MCRVGAGSVWRRKRTISGYGIQLAHSLPAGQVQHIPIGRILYESSGARQGGIVCAVRGHALVARSTRVGPRVPPLH